MHFDEIDFNALYKQQKEATTFKMKSQAAWDNKAASMNERVHDSIYNEQFLDLLNLSGCKTVLDVGCGVGNLSLRLGTQLQTVYALDYSSKMLSLLEENAKEKKLNNINPINYSWYDDWSSIPKADIVLASRSLEVKDMKEALTKLHNHAKKRVYLSYKVGGTFVSQAILDVMQREVIKKPDYIYVMNILYSMGITASVNFIQSEGRSSVYKNCEHFIQSIAWSLGELTNTEKQRLEAYYESDVKNNKHSSDFVSWAVISWEV